MSTTSLIKQFRRSIYQVPTKRADATLDFVDALTVAGHVSSPVALSEEKPFRRKFSSIYDVLSNGRLEESKLQKSLAQHQPSDCETIAGYEVHAIDTTPDERAEAATLEERVNLKAQKNAPVRVGQKFSWLARLVKQSTSWVAPLDVHRVKSGSTDSHTAVEQIKLLDKQNERPKVVVADSLYANKVFLAVFLVVQQIVALVRMRSNANLREAPQPKPAGRSWSATQTWSNIQIESASPRSRPNRNVLSRFTTNPFERLA